MRRNRTQLVFKQGPQAHNPASPVPRKGGFLLLAFDANRDLKPAGLFYEKSLEILRVPGGFLALKSVFCGRINAIEMTAIM